MEQVSYKEAIEAINKAFKVEEENAHLTYAKRLESLSPEIIECAMEACVVEDRVKVASNFIEALSTCNHVPALYEGRYQAFVQGVAKGFSILLRKLSSGSSFSLLDMEKTIHKYCVNESIRLNDRQEIFRLMANVLRPNSEDVSTAYMYFICMGLRAGAEKLEELEINEKDEAKKIRLREDIREVSLFYWNLLGNLMISYAESKYEAKLNGIFKSIKAVHINEGEKIFGSQVAYCAQMLAEEGGLAGLSLIKKKTLGKAHLEKCFDEGVSLAVMTLTDIVSTSLSALSVKNIDEENIQKNKEHIKESLYKIELLLNAEDDSVLQSMGILKKFAKYSLGFSVLNKCDIPHEFARYASARLLNSIDASVNVLYLALDAAYVIGYCRLEGANAAFSVLTDTTQKLSDTYPDLERSIQEARKEGIRAHLKQTLSSRSEFTP